MNTRAFVQKKQAKLASALKDAVSSHQRGDFDRAERRYAEILATRPDHFDAGHNLALIRCQQGRYPDGLELIATAVKANPTNTSALSNFGLILTKLGRPAEAIAKFDAALAIRPDFATALNNRGNALLDLGRRDEALENYDRALAIRPDFPDAHNNRGNALQALGRSNEALACYDRALGIKPDYVEALANLGNAQAILGRLDEALVSYERALALDPRYQEALAGRDRARKLLEQREASRAAPDTAATAERRRAEALFLQGNALLNLGQSQEALAMYEEALALEPRHLDGLNNRGVALQNLGRMDEALASYDKALAVKPDYPGPYNNRSVVLLELGRPEEALAEADKALAIKPDLFNARYNRGNALHDLGRPEEAIASYDEALVIRPDYPEALFNRGMTALELGRFAEGWAGYEHRWAQKNTPKKLVEFYPEWKGEDIGGKSIVVYEEQGLGDIIQFSRFLPRLVASGARVAFFVRPTMHRFLRPFASTIDLTSRPLREGDFAFRCALMSLPGVLGTTVDAIPADIPYLFPEAALVERWRRRIGERGFKIGIAWQGKPTDKIDVGRSIPLRCFQPLAALQGVRLISLQKNVGLDQLDSLPAGMTIENLGAELDNGPHAFVDTAAAMSCLDLVVTSDTSIAHVAGALGRPVWVALKRVPDWRWLLDRPDTPWYPTMRLYRQAARGHWDAVLARIAADIAGLVAERGRTETKMPALAQETRDELAPMLREAIGLHQRGELDQAARLYLAILEARPAHFDATRHLAVVRSQQGRNLEGLDLIAAAVKSNPASASALSNFGLILTKLHRPEEALAKFDAALALEPEFALALNNRGNALLDLGRPLEAVASYEKALAVRPDFADALNNRGNALRALGRPDEALASIDRALAVAPDFLEALNNRGGVLVDLERPEEALASYDKAIAIKRDYADALDNRSVALRNLGRLQEALASVDEALAVAPDSAGALNNRGIVLADLGRVEEALASYDKSLALRRDNAEALFNRGNALADPGRLEEALSSWDEALAIRPDYSEALNNRGKALVDVRRAGEALSSLDKALAIRPAYAEALNNRGNALVALQRPEDALASFDQAIAVKANYPLAYNNRAISLSELGRFEEALASYDKALALEPDLAEALYNRGSVQLLLGDWPAGWTGYESRWDHADAPRRRLVASCPIWRGEDLAGKRIIVDEEQGLGDVIQFSRFLIGLSEKAASVTFHVRSSLHRLLRPLTSTITLVGEPPRDESFDFQCALLSLPAILGTTPETVPSDVPYLVAESPLVDDWRRRLGGQGLKIGIAWQGNPAAKIDIGRSVPLRCFHALAAVPGVRLISLQKNVGLEQLADLPSGVRIETLGVEFDNGPSAFVDTAAVMSCLDLIVTSDTAIAHLAGALGRPVWVALKRTPDWRWLLDRSDSPWYPTMKLYRQAARGDWEGVFSRMAVDAARLADPRIPTSSENPAPGREEQRRLERALETAAQMLKRGEFDEAERRYLEILEAQPDQFDAKHYLAVTRFQKGDAREGLELIEAAVKSNPTSASALSNYGLILMRSNRFEEALAKFDAALAIKPDSALTLNNRASVLIDLGRLREAIASCEAALALEPDFAGALNNRGNALQDLGMPEEALADYDRALALKPDFQEAHCNRASALIILERREEALASYDKALAIAPGYADAHFNRGTTALSMGDFPSGWAGYEHRWEQRPKPKKPVQVYPEWRGEDLEGKRIVVYEEQGAGDVIQFARLLPRLAASGAIVTFFVRASLRRLLRPLGSTFRTVDRLTLDEPYDFQCALMSLPGIFGTTLETIPSGAPYLFPEAALVDRWRQRIGDRGLKIGIAWQGRAGKRIDMGRSVPLRCFRALAAVPGVRLISLQKHDGLDQLSDLPSEMTIENLGAELDEGPDAFVDTAAAMSSLDLIVTSDTAVAHLAGALGRPVWVALKQAPDWRWLLGRADSPWYPSMRLYRQSIRDDWDGVFERIATDAAALAGARQAERGTEVLQIPGSIGELFDKITILEIKAARIDDANKLRNVSNELALLRALESRFPPRENHAQLVAELKNVNEALWEIEDAIRECERRSEFGAEFVSLARSVYKTNDRRAEIKKQLNVLHGSRIVEEKNYAKYV